MFHIFRRYTRKSYHTILKWMESDKFDKDVREFLTGLVERASSLEQLPKNWAELVSLVIIDEQCEPRMSAYTRRVIEGWFPHAKFRASRFQGAVQPIWRDAEVTPIEEGQKPSAAEVLGWPVSQLPGLPGSFQTWGTLFDMKVEDLVRSRTAHLRERGHDKAVVDQIQEALQLYGLWLGMSYEQIEHVRQGLVPTTAVGLTPERSGAVC